MHLRSSPPTTLEPDPVTDTGAHTETHPGTHTGTHTGALDISTLDRSALATAQLVISTHSNRAQWLNTADIVATYHWMLRDTGLPPGLRIYDTPRAATTYLHGFRLCDNRAEICQDPDCPGGDLGPAEARAAVMAAGIPEPDAFALATTRYVMGYHPSPDEAVETLAVYAWVLEARSLEALVMPEPTCGADRNVNRVDHAAAASTLLHELREAHGRDLPCAHCSHPDGDLIGTSSSPEHELLGLTITDPGPMLDAITDLSDIPEFDGLTE